MKFLVKNFDEIFRSEKFSDFRFSESIFSTFLIGSIISDGITSRPQGIPRPVNILPLRQRLTYKD